MWRILFDEKLTVQASGFAFYSIKLNCKLSQVSGTGSDYIILFFLLFSANEFFPFSIIIVTSSGLSVFNTSFVLKSVSII